MTTNQLTRWPLIFLALFLCQCRAELAEDDTRLTSTSDVWFNSFGESSECEPVAKACVTVDNDKPFIDACVEAGHKAKTCGCSVKCSGEIAYKRARPVSKTRTSGNNGDCTADDLSYLQSMKETLVKTRELADCINGHVCKGHTVFCTQTDAKVSHHIRTLGNTTCESDVADLFCPSGLVDSWECPAPTVDTLSREWAAAFQIDDKPLRLCFQGLVCNDNESRCAPTLLDRARSIKTMLEESSCRYWYESFCRLGADGSL